MASSLRDRTLMVDPGFRLSAILDMRMILIKTSGFNVYEWLKPAFCRL
ncbi:MAG TPA: hypothetical protein IGS53_19665 [Leptolyngbyaceae cyanobacterium M33_DOE_097]|nr:hypothetical protein [Leptolyngbyaceae cyanobacterium M33_DOE_097]